MLNSISTSTVGSPAPHGVPAPESDPGLANAFGDLLAQLSAPAENATTAKLSISNSTSTPPSTEVPQSSKNAPISAATLSDLASLLTALPMPTPTTAAPVPANSPKVPKPDKDTPDNAALQPAPSSLLPSGVSTMTLPTIIATVETSSPAPGQQRAESSSEPASPLPDHNAALAATASAAATTSVTTVVRPINFAAFDVKTIDVQTESMAAPPQLGPLKGAIDSRILAELQNTPHIGPGLTADPAPLTDGNPLNSDGTSTAASLPPSVADTSPVSTATAVAASAQAPDSAPLNSVDATQAKTLTGVQTGSALTQEAAAIPAITDGNTHGASQQESGTEHEKHTADQPSKNEMSDVPVSFGTSAPFQTQIARSEPSQPVSHMPDLPAAPQSLTAHRVSIDIGENESRVTVTLHERGGDVSVKIHSASEPLGTQLQSSVGSLVEALHREHVSLTNMDFTSGFAKGSDQGNPRDPQPQQSPRPAKIKTASLPTDDIEFETAPSGINVNG